MAVQKKTPTGIATLFIANHPWGAAVAGCEVEATEVQRGDVAIEFDDPKVLDSTIGKLLTKKTVFSVELDDDAADNDKFLDAVECLGFDKKTRTYVPGNNSEEELKLVRVLYRYDAEKAFRTKSCYDDGKAQSDLDKLIDSVYEIYIYADDITQEDAKALKLGKETTFLGIPCYHIVNE